MINFIKRAKEGFQIVILIFFNSNIYSQETPLGSKIVGNGDNQNYYIGHFPVGGSDGLDIHWYGGIRFGDFTSNSVMQISGGNVGIGTNLPSSKLDIVGEYGAGQIKWRALNGQYGYTYSDSGGIGITNGNPFSELIYFHTVNKSLHFYTNSIQRAIIDNNGNFGIGTATPSNLQSWNKVLDVAGDHNSKILATAENSTYRVGIFSHNQEWYGGGGFVGTESNHPLHFITNYTSKMSILTNGYVGIGTTVPDEKLTVKGKIHTQEVRVDMAGPLVPDYVFANDYKLKSLQEIEDYIKENKHLPEIPSADEIEENGLMLAKMNMSLLKKIEEMTLYMIEMKKEIETLKKDKK